MMKKVLSLLLAVILLASLTLTASTAEEEVFDGYVIVRLLENAAHIGLPIPDKLRDILSQLHDKERTTDQGDGE